MFDPFVDFNPNAEADRICQIIEETVHRQFRRQGAVVGISGGLDSSVVLALAVRALGADQVLGLLLPEKESDPLSARLADQLAVHFGAQTLTEDISPALEGFGCYRRRDEAMQAVIPQYQPGWPVRIILPGSLLEGSALNYFSLETESPQGEVLRKRLPLREYRQIVAASNFKQRVRTNFLYYHAESLNYAVLGTPNKNEHELGFFVRWGDGGYDLAPIRHLFKTQVFALATALGVPDEIIQRKPTTDTYPGAGSQEDFFYRLPFATLDGIWAAWEDGQPFSAIADNLNLREDQILAVVNDIITKKRAAAYLQHPPSGIDPAPPAQ